MQVQHTDVINCSAACYNHTVTFTKLATDSASVVRSNFGNFGGINPTPWICPSVAHKKTEYTADIVAGKTGHRPSWTPVTAQQHTRQYFCRHKMIASTHLGLANPRNVQWNPWHMNRFSVPVSGTGQRVPETSHICRGFRYRFLPIPIAGTIYTLNHKKRDISFLTITLANLNWFLQFLYHFNREEILHATVVKFITSP